MRLLQDIANIVAIAVSNALAYEEIKSLKEQLLLENRYSRKTSFNDPFMKRLLAHRGHFRRCLPQSTKLRKLTRPF